MEKTQETRKLLILVASTDIEQSEVNNIASQAELYGIEPIIHTIDSINTLDKVLVETGQIDYLYLASHGCEDHMGDISGTVKITWQDFATSMCESAALSQNTIFMHSCCRGGLNQVAWKMFDACELIGYVCGPRSNVTPVDLITAFNLFIYNVERKGVDPVAAAKKVELATDVRLVCFDRVEETSSFGYLHFTGEFVQQVYIPVNNQAAKPVSVEKTDVLPMVPKND